MPTVVCSSCGRQYNTQIIACPECGTPVGYSGGEAVDPQLLSASEEAREEASAWNREGLDLLNGGKHDEAVAAFTRAIAAHSYYVVAYRNRARAYEAMGRVVEAQADLETWRSRSGAAAAIGASQPAPRHLQMVDAAAPVKEGKGLQLGAMIVGGIVGFVLSFMLGIVVVAIEGDLSPSVGLLIVANLVSLFIAGVVAGAMSDRDTGTEALHGMGAGILIVAVSLPLNRLLGFGSFNISEAIMAAGVGIVAGFLGGSAVLLMRRI